MRFSGFWRICRNGDKGGSSVAEKIKPELLNFLAPGELPLKILVVESVDYLPELREMFPVAEIYAAAAEPELREKEEFRGLRVAWSILDYRETPLPFPREFFDYIIGDLTLEHVGNPQDIAAGLGMFLKQTGAWLTSFRNIRHWSVLEHLLEGHYYNVVSRLYAKQEFERLMYACFYKEVRVASQRRKGAPELIQRLEEAGFDNTQGDLEVEFWLVRAARSMPEMALLKSMYTAEERKELSRILHRIEYGIDAERQCEALWALYDRAGMFPDYLAAFAKQAVFHHRKFYGNLIACSPKRRGLVRDVLQAALGESAGDEEREMLLELVRNCHEIN